MDKIDELLLYIRKTNPEITKEELISRLLKSEYVTKSLINTFEQNTKNDST